MEESKNIINGIRPSFSKPPITKSNNKNKENIRKDSRVAKRDSKNKHK